jgi:hypothetical protein
MASVAVIECRHTTSRLRAERSRSIVRHYQLTDRSGAYRLLVLGIVSVRLNSYAKNTTLLAMCKCSQLIHLGDLHFKEALNGDPGDMLARGLLAQDDYR